MLHLIQESCQFDRKSDWIPVGASVAWWRVLGLSSAPSVAMPRSFGRRKMKASGTFARIAVNTRRGEAGFVFEVGGPVSKRRG